MADEVATRIGLDHVPYSLDVWHGKLASTCRLMTDEDTSLVSFYEATGYSWFPDNLTAALLMGDEFFEKLRDLFVFDALIVNTDRHASNFGFLRDNATGAIISVAPAYDHNLSLFIRDMPQDFASWEERAGNALMKTANLTFDEFAGMAVTEKHHEWARKLLEFDFGSQSRSFGELDAERLANTANLVRSRARHILSIPPDGGGGLKRRLKPRMERLKPALEPALALAARNSRGTAALPGTCPPEPAPASLTADIKAAGTSAEAQARHAGARTEKRGFEHDGPGGTGARQGRGMRGELT